MVAVSKCGEGARGAPREDWRQGLLYHRGAPFTCMNPTRYDRLDALRGVAIVWMAVFHLLFDLNHFKLQPAQNFYVDPVWTVQRTCIVTLFLFCAGLGQAVALHHAQPWRRFWKRWLQIFDCAVLVTVASAFMFPHSWISFGVLHGIAVMLVLVRWMAPLRHALWIVGAVAIALPHVVSHPFFDSRWTNWIGLVTRKPITEDFVPVLPWLGVMCFGLAAGQTVLSHAPMLLKGDIPWLLRPLAGLGRWSLSFYMLHQPVFIGAILAYLHWRR
jgi:uncharacterized membrane protein